MPYPRLVRLRQHFERPRIDDVPRAVRTALDKLGLERAIRPGHTVALTAGSRGIANIPVVLRSTAEYLRELGARPFIVPAMGSHGGGTAEGQRKILESYGIAEGFVGVPIKASMDVVSLGTTPEGFPVVLDRFASEADHIGVVARVKPHTAFQGPIESGLLKMLMIGLGKHAGAIAYHRLLVEQPYDLVVRAVGRRLCAQAPIRFGLALVENGYDETALIEAVAPGEFEPREEELLAKARRWLARLPWSRADLLIIDEIGKDISGSGMDTNVVGRKRAFRDQLSLDGQPRIRHIYVRGLTKNTLGNATGIGLADFTTTGLVKTMNYQATVINCLTAGYPEGANIPVYFDTDRQVLDAALAIMGTRTAEQGRVMRIRNTLMLDELWASEACLEEAVRETDFSVVGEPAAITFDAEGNLSAW